MASAATTYPKLVRGLIKTREKNGLSLPKSIQSRIGQFKSLNGGAPLSAVLGQAKKPSLWAAGRRGFASNIPKPPPSSAPNFSPRIPDLGEDARGKVSSSKQIQGEKKGSGF
jgi:hypothetical protein